MNRGTWITIGGFVLLLVVIGILVIALNRPAVAPPSNQTSTNQSNQGVSAMQQSDEVVGNGAEAVSGKTVTVNYVGTLENGTKFDSSYDHSQPFSFQLGAGQVIKGWDQGVVGMKVGGKRKLVIPPELGYGTQSAGSIPPNSTLIFEIELLDVK